ncbi:ABC transporter permease [Kineococcus sp. SYSU DK006]|uniref:ABC transporter permease n=1 Tax=Kineococcus sp. SYSU DK006 TaxID=3383127 RepID=UPI003D7C3871
MSQTRVPAQSSGPSGPGLSANLLGRRTRPLAARRTGGRRAWPRWATIVILLATWQLAAVLNGDDRFYNAALIPSPWQVLRAAGDLAASGELWTDTWTSTLRVLAGLGVAAPVAVLAAALTTASRTLSNVLDPVIDVLRPVPTLALLPMFILWFGVGETSKVMLIAFSTFFLIYVPSVEAIRNVDPVLVQAAGTLGLTRTQRYRHVIAPSAAPAIFVGLRMALGTGWFLVVGAEFIAADNGLGYLINFSRIWFRVSDMLVGAAVIAVLGLLGNALLLRLEQRLFAWRERA